MVLIPEEKLLRYEEQLNDQPLRTNRRGDPYSQGVFVPPFIIYWELFLDMDYLYNYPGSMVGRGEEDTGSMSVEMIVRSIPKSMKKRAEALLAHLKEKRRCYYMGRYGTSPRRWCSYTQIEHYRFSIGCDEIP